MPRTAQSTIEERLSEQSRRIKMLEEVFVPMAKTAMEIIAGKPGEPGMAEDLRNVRSQLEELIKRQKNDAQETMKIRTDGFTRIEKLEADKEHRLLGIKVSSETRVSIISGLFMLLSIVIAGLLK
jgi:hypothetical protein